ncbi:MAG: hypothetical protein ACKV2V_06760 [Blastocatellia bacterium]
MANNPYDKPFIKGQRRGTRYEDKQGKDYIPGRRYRRYDDDESEDYESEYVEYYDGDEGEDYVEEGGTKSLRGEKAWVEDDDEDEEEVVVRKKRNVRHDPKPAIKSGSREDLFGRDEETEDETEEEIVDEDAEDEEEYEEEFVDDEEDYGEDDDDEYDDEYDDDDGDEDDEDEEEADDDDDDDVVAGKKDDGYIGASELAEFSFCPAAWDLHRRGYQDNDEAEIRKQEGVDWHEEQVEDIELARKLRWFLIPGLILLAIALLIRIAVTKLGQP